MDKDTEKEIEKIKERLVKLEKHVGSCDEHEKTEEHSKKQGKPHH